MRRDRSYKELKTELAICQIGGLFLAIYDDENVRDIIISQLQEDLPEYFQFRLHITDEKKIFPIFFSQTFEQIGKQSNIFHLLGIEALSEESQKEFIQSLQYGRERFKAMAYSIVFWIHPGFVKKLFHDAPDFHHWVFSTYDFAGCVNDSITDCQNGLLLHEKEAIFLKNIDDYLKRLIWQYEHWQEVKESGKNFLLEVMSRTNLYEYYVKMDCESKEGEVLLLDDLLDKFLNDKTSFLTLLGDFGTGKSSFSLYYFIIQAKLYLQNKFRRIPLFVSLKDYPQKLNIKTFIQNEFAKKFELSFSLAVFQNLMLQGKFLFFIDGFDEMVSMSDKEETIENFKELTKLTFEQVQFMMLSQTEQKSKIFMTCRTHYFFTETQEQAILKADYTVLYRNYATRSQYQITRINVKEFNSKQIEEYILKNTENEQSAQEFLKIINDTYNLKELSTRPLLLNMIVKTLPLLKNKQEINAADLYREYTNEWIERDDWRSRMTPQGKRQFMWELASKMYQKGGDFSLHYSLLDKPHKSFCKSDCIENHNDDYFTYETTTCSFLHRDSEGNYKFIHKSFMEYFFAEYFFDCIENHKSRPIEYSKTNDEIQFFLKMIVAINKQRLNGLDLSGLKLDRINLKRANLNGVNFKDTNLNGTLLEGSQLDWEYSFTNTIGMKFVYIPPGEFMMGSPKNEPGRSEDETQHKVKLIRGFYFQTTPVTQGQWKKIMVKNLSYFKGCGNDCPVENVSWYNTLKFIEKINVLEKTNLYRLPTEAEWEYACRAGSNFAYCFGNDIEKLKEYAWFDKNSGWRTHSTANLKANRWGLYDMHGNVWEWCQNWYGEDIVENAANPISTDTGSYRVNRGGSCFLNSRYCRSANRNSDHPDNHFGNLGFRVLREAPY